MGKKNLGLVHDSFVTALANGSTTYVELPTAEGVCGVGIRWPDATSNATITLQSTNESPDDVAGTSTTAGDWGDEGVAVTGPTGAGAGCSSNNLGNIGMERLRLKIVAAADTKLRIRVNWRSQ